MIMNGFIQVGTTALRDPGTGEFLPAVPLYVRAEDSGKCESIVIDADAFQKELLEKYKAYRKEERRRNHISHVSHMSHAEPEKEDGC